MGRQKGSPQAPGQALPTRLPVLGFSAAGFLRCTWPHGPDGQAYTASHPASLLPPGANHKRESLEPNSRSGLRGKPPLPNRPSMRLCPECGDFKGKGTPSLSPSTRWCGPERAKRLGESPAENSKYCPASTSPVLLSPAIP